jgi:hypothetical protein
VPPESVGACHGWKGRQDRDLDALGRADRRTWAHDVVTTAHNCQRPTSASASAHLQNFAPTKGRTDSPARAVDAGQDRARREGKNENSVRPGCQVQHQATEGAGPPYSAAPILCHSSYRHSKSLPFPRSRGHKTWLPIIKCCHGCACRRRLRRGERHSARRRRGKKRRGVASRRPRCTDSAPTDVSRVRAREWHSRASHPIWDSRTGGAYCARAEAAGRAAREATEFGRHATAHRWKGPDGANPGFYVPVSVARDIAADHQAPRGQRQKA